jgi:hypothetical protein
MGIFPYCQRCCIEDDFAKRSGMRAIRRTKAQEEEPRCKRPQFRAAEKRGEGMA